MYPPNTDTITVGDCILTRMAEGHCGAVYHLEIAGGAERPIRYVRAMMRDALIDHPNIGAISTSRSWQLPNNVRATECVTLFREHTTLGD